MKTKTNDFFFKRLNIQTPQLVFRLIIAIKHAKFFGMTLITCVLHRRYTKLIWLIAVEMRHTPAGAPVSKFQFKNIVCVT